MKKVGTILEAINSPLLWQRWFKEPVTWANWRTFLAAFFALPLSPAELELFKRCTGRDQSPGEQCKEGWLICGRRGGKSMILALCAAWLSCFHDWRSFFSPGERGHIFVMATGVRQARVIRRYISALIAEVPTLARLIDRESDDQIDLTNGISIVVEPANFRTVRGYSIVAALLDEASFWRDDEFSASPDIEVLNALRPAMASVPGAILLVASSPYAQRGIVYNAFHRHFGRSGPVLVWRADTRTMNPTISASFIAEEFEKDPVVAASEYGRDGTISFRQDIESFVSRAVIDACTVTGRHELPPRLGVNFIGAVDVAGGGGGGDSFTLAVASRSKEGVAVLDCVREVRPPFSPDAVVSEFATLLKTYRISKVVGDYYGGEWPIERFRAHGIVYEPSARPKSEVYQALLPLLNSGRVELLEIPRLGYQLQALERRVGRSGRDQISEAQGSHDDVCNAAALVLTRCVENSGADGWVQFYKKMADAARDGTFAARYSDIGPAAERRINKWRVEQERRKEVARQVAEPALVDVHIGAPFRYFRMADGQLYISDERGWIRGVQNAHRKHLPERPPPEGAMTPSD
jgi:hypothetical protein